MAGVAFDLSKEGLGLVAGLGLGGLISTTVSDQARGLLVGKTPSTVGDVGTIAINLLSLGLGFTLPMAYLPGLVGFDERERAAMMVGLGLGMAPLAMVTLSEIMALSKKL